MDAASNAAFRFTFGLILLAAVVRYFWNGWIDEQLTQPTYFFTYPGLGWVQPWPAPWMHVHFAVLGACALGVALGFFYRAAAVTFFIGFTYVHLIDKSNYLNHYYLVSLIALLCAFLPLGSTGALDAMLGRVQTRDWVPAWMPWLLRFQLAVVYIFGGLGKLNADWLLAAQPLRIWLPRSSDLPVVGPILEETWVAHAASYAGLAFDLGVVPLLLLRRTRAAAYLLVIGFHAATAVLFPIGIFPWLMAGLTPIFFDYGWPRTLARVLGVKARAMAAPPSLAGKARQRWMLACAAAFAAVQVLLPLRSLASRGNRLWTEEGFRFSWNVMLSEKVGLVDFILRDPATGETWSEAPERYLTPFQARMMSTQPDMILQLARSIAERHGSEGRPGIEVRADAEAALNGRPRQRLIDPGVDLARVQDSWQRPWVLPLEEGECGGLAPRSGDAEPGN